MFEAVSLFLALHHFARKTPTTVEKDREKFEGVSATKISTSSFLNQTFKADSEHRKAFAPSQIGRDRVLSP